MYRQITVENKCFFNIFKCFLVNFKIDNKLQLKNELSFDVVVIGGSLLECEAAAAQQVGVNTALFTHKFDTIGEMSCNPAMTVWAKGIVREIDALDGVMGVADKSHSI